METLILQRAFIIGLIVICIWACFLESMIFGKIRDIDMPDWLAQPLWNCPICMVPYYGSVVYWLVFKGSIIEWILVIMVAMGINTIFVKVKKN